MKFSILALGAAVAGISCVNQCAAQLSIESPSSRGSAPATRLVSRAQDGLLSADDDQANSSGNNSNNNSDYFAEQNPQAEIDDPQSMRGDRSVLERPVVKANAGGAATQASMDVLAVTPEVGMVPVYWPQAGGCPTPNPVASYMMRSWCADGLWSTYPCQRQQQCQRIQQHIHGVNRYTCGTAACAAPASSCASGSCATGSCGAPAGGCASTTTPNSAAQLASAAPQPAANNGLLGDMQAGLPAIPAGALPGNNMLPPAQLTSAPAGLIQTWPASVPQASNVLPPLPIPGALPGAVPTTEPSIQNAPINVPSIELPALPNALPVAPLPASNPVVASRPSATLR